MSAMQISFGIRLAITLPTILSFISFILRYLLAKETPTKPMAEMSLTKVSEELGRKFLWDFFLDSIILAMANGLILMFELQRVEWGVILMFSGIVVVLLGFVCLEKQMYTGASFSVFLLIMLFICELTYFAFFGISFNLFGFVLLPRYIAIFPAIFVLLLILVTGYSMRKHASN